MYMQFSQCHWQEVFITQLRLLRSSMDMHDTHTMPRHRHHDISVAVACHSLSDTQATVLTWQLFHDANEV